MNNKNNHKTPKKHLRAEDKRTYKRLNIGYFANNFIRWYSILVELCFM